MVNVVPLLPPQLEFLLALEYPLALEEEPVIRLRTGLVDYLKDSDLANRLSRYLAARSPTSVLAGNPSSLQSSLAASAFDSGTDTGSGGDSGGDGGDGGTASGGGAAMAAAANHAFPVGLQFGRYRQGGKDVNNHSLPLRYAYEWADGRKLNVGLPLSYVTVGDAKVYRIGLEVGYTLPMNDRWKLTPGIGYGLVGSKDLLSGAQIGSFSLTSLYTFDKSVVGGDNWSLSVGNMAGYYKTFPIKVADVKIDPDLKNQIVKNGLIPLITRPGSRCR